MKFNLKECTCSVDKPYADGTLPLFYTDMIKAAYAFNKLSEKCRRGVEKSQKEYILICCDDAELTGDSPYITKCKHHGINKGRWQSEPLKSLKESNLYWGVHHNGLHILGIK